MVQSSHMVKQGQERHSQFKVQQLTSMGKKLYADQPMIKLNNLKKEESCRDHSNTFLIAWKEIERRQKAQKKNSILNR
jgi:hypothetical protein